MKTFQIGDLLRLRKNQRFAYIYDETGFVADNRKAMFHDEDNTMFPDNDMRMIFFTKGVLETVKKLGWTPDIIHCHGWFTSLMPLYVKQLYKRDPHFADTKIVTSLYEDVFDGTLDNKVAQKISFDGISSEQQDKFMRQFTLHYQRGGG